MKVAVNLEESLDWIRSLDEVDSITVKSEVAKLQVRDEGRSACLSVRSRREEEEKRT